MLIYLLSSNLSMIFKGLKTSSEILQECHDEFIKSGIEKLSMQPDVKIVFSDGILYYSKLLVSFVIPELQTLLCDHTDSDEICQTILFPEIRKDDFVTTYFECWQTNAKKEVSSPPSSCSNDSEVLKSISRERSIENETKGDLPRNSYPTLSEGPEVIDEENLESLKTAEFVSTSEVDEKLCKKNRDDGKISDLLCHSCGKSFTNSGKLKKHMYNVHHSATLLFQCTLCEKRFSSKEFLNRHKSLNHESRINQCKICLKVFKTLIEFKQHERSHKVTQKEFECQVCGKTNEKKFNHERHLLLHNNTKKFQCDICTLEFTLKQHLERHKMSHDKKLFTYCPLCHRSFNRKENMKRHLLTCKAKVS